MADTKPLVSNLEIRLSSYYQEHLLTLSVKHWNSRFSINKYTVNQKFPKKNIKLAFYMSILFKILQRACLLIWNKKLWLNFRGWIKEVGSRAKLSGTLVCAYIFIRYISMNVVRAWYVSWNDWNVPHVPRSRFIAPLILSKFSGAGW